ncbi:MAG: uroporphyrinogen-III synthase, partial [Clostridia bacterium]
HRTVTGTLADIADKAKKADLPRPGLIVVGETVTLGSKIGKRKSGLSGKKILATGTKSAITSIRREINVRGGEVTEISLIRTVPINRHQLENLNPEEFSHIVFFSPNGVDIFFDFMRESGKDVRSLAGTRIAAVGERTAVALRNRGIASDIVPKKFNSAGMAECLEKELDSKSRVLLLRADAPRNAVGEMLTSRGVPFLDLPIYKTEAEESKRELLNLSGDFDYIIVMSGSAAAAFKTMYNGKINGKIVSIGPETAREARAVGLDVDITAERADAAGIAEAILNDCRESDEK